ncbi:E3 ubiquitin-protein ligase makorin [Entomortierella parvispora]|uniref:E3 ubiquitin-protein ligase makorin n=1 Tax=Entomortierella parvispora TaxID=205924 RepID=A0A9P3LWX9_9FUNG|nr:E3 ubiquitin-protein ligase makorin [Entomortierella parvispora]
MTTQPCRFFLAGTCRNGSQCRFYHEGFSSISRATLLEAEGEPDTSEASTSSSSSSSSSSPQAPSSARPSTLTQPTPGSARPTFAQMTPCRWYLAGYCCRGEACWFSHDRAVIGTALGGEYRSRDGEDSESLYPDAAENASVSAAPALEEDDMKCAICFEIPSTFGLLASCNHAFCLECIRTWRSKEITDDMQPHERGASVTKACPNCRTRSLFVIPSSILPTSPEQKEAIVQNYKEVISQRPCKYFTDSGDRRWCPFGEDCFFAHLDENGQRSTVNPNSNPRLNRRRHHHGPRQDSRWDFHQRVAFRSLAHLGQTVMDSRDHVEGLRNLLMRLQNMQINPDDSWGVSSTVRAPTSSRPWDHDHNWEYDDDDDDEDDEFVASDIEYGSEYEDFDDADYEGGAAYVGHTDEVYLESDYDDYY